ncbi:MAG: hypothetical protein ACLQI7_26630 [Streptosporangiaceae bacterium]
MQEPLAGWHVVAVARVHALPGVPGRVICRKAEVGTLELALGRELAPRPPLTLLNLSPQHICQLQCQRAIRSRVKALRHHPP